MSQTTRYVLFVIISIAIMWAFAPKQTPRPAPGSNTPVSTSPSTPTPAPTGATPPVAGTPPELKAAEPDTAAGPSVQIEGGQWTAIVSLRGAGLESFVLKGAKQSQRTQTAGEPGAGMNLAHAGFGQPLPLAVDLSSLPPAGSFGPNAVYEAQPAQPGQNERTFTRTRNGITVTKRLSWKPDTYQLRLDVSVTGAPAGTYPMRVLYAVNEPPVPPAGMFSTGPRPEAHATVCLIEGDRSITSRAFTSNKPLETLHGHPVFTGIDEKYFIAAMSPGADAAPSTCQIGSGTGAGENTAVLERTLTVAANAPTTSSVDLYIGPKDTKSLAAADHSLTRSIDFGYFGFLNIICEGLLFVLNLLHAVARNWGIAIILLTMIVKGATLPLTHKQMQSMEKTKQLNPLIEKIKQKYAGDQERINAETMKLFKEQKHQPLAGCLPMLVQMPVWFALYSTLSTSFELYKEPFIHGWINDLTARDPFYILPVAMTATMMLTQVLTPQAGPPNAQMKTMMYVMPVMFGFFMLSLPAGLVLYIFTNNLLSITQSLWFRRRVAQTQTPPLAR